MRLGFHAPVTALALVIALAACTAGSGLGTAADDYEGEAPGAGASPGTGQASGAFGADANSAATLPPLSLVHVAACATATTGTALVPQPGVTYVLTEDKHVGLGLQDDSVAAGGVLAQGPVTFTMDQLFTFETAANGAFYVRAYHSDLLLAADARGSIAQGDTNDASSQWRVVSSDGNHYALVQDTLGGCLTLPDGNQTLFVVADKKGWSGWDSDWNQIAGTFRPSWLYDWGSGGDPNTLPARTEYVPMVWGYYGDANGLKAYLSAAGSDPNVKHILAYNEPDNTGQANLDVNTAISTWPWFLAQPKPVGSPAGTQATGPWMTTFMAAVQDNVAFVTVHWYGGTSAASLQSYLQATYEAYQRPIWITEFAPADWNSSSVDGINFSTDDVTTFMQQILPMLDSLPYVQRYAWFEAGPTDAALGHSILQNADGSLTGAGQLYADYPFVP